MRVTRAWPLLGERLAIEFANTCRILPTGDVREGLDTPSALCDWAADHGRTLPDVDERVLGHAVELRDSLRSLLSSAAIGLAPDRGAVMVVKDASRMGGDGVASLLLLGEVAQDGADLLAGVDRPRLAFCARDVCGSFFVRGHPQRQWCSNRCGDAIRRQRCDAGRRAAT